MTPQIVTRARRNTSPLWAVTCLFGEVSNGRRLANYRVFRDALQVPLITVELAFDGPTQLTRDDADVVISLNGGDAMWQKERLLNVALAHLPDACRYVAWLDSDVILRREDWPRATCRLLDEFPVAQLFERVLECPRDADPHNLTPATADGVSHSFGWRWRHNQVFDRLRLRKGTRIEKDCAAGMAWAARRDLLDTFGFYDACIAGAGDRAMIGAMTGRCKDVIHGLRMTEPFAQHYLRWAGPVHEQVGSRIAYLAGDAVHLWHGNPRLRHHHQSRHVVMNQWGFDPTRDIALTDDGTWCFVSDKPELHEFFHAYFDERKMQEMIE